MHSQLRLPSRKSLTICICAYSTSYRLFVRYFRWSLTAVKLWNWKYSRSCRPRQWQCSMALGLIGCSAHRSLSLSRGRPGWLALRPDLQETRDFRGREREKEDGKSYSAVVAQSVVIKITLFSVADDSSIHLKCSWLCRLQFPIRLIRFNLLPSPLPWLV